MGDLGAPCGWLPLPGLITRQTPSGPAPEAGACCRAGELNCMCNTGRGPWTAPRGEDALHGWGVVRSIFCAELHANMACHQAASNLP